LPFPCLPAAAATMGALRLLLPPRAVLGSPTPRWVVAACWVLDYTYQHLDSPRATVHTCCGCLPGTNACTASHPLTAACLGFWVTHCCFLHCHLCLSTAASSMQDSVPLPASLHSTVQFCREVGVCLPFHCLCTGIGVLFGCLPATTALLRAPGRMDATCLGGLLPAALLACHCCRYPVLWFSTPHLRYRHLLPACLPLHPPLPPPAGYIVCLQCTCKSAHTCIY